MITFTPMTTAGVNKGLYYYGARYNDPRVSVWLSVDPLASKYPYITPYNFVENNPVNLIDPTGLGPQTYEVDDEGKAEKVDNTKYYRNNETGEVSNTNCDNCTEVDKVRSKGDPDQHIYVDRSVMRYKHIIDNVPIKFSTPSGIEKSEETPMRIYSFTNPEKAKSFFEFVADNTNVEWDNTQIVTGAGIQNKVTTIYDKGISAGLGYFDKFHKLRWSDHSHPDGSGIHSGDARKQMNLSKKNKGIRLRIYRTGIGYDDFHNYKF